MSFQFLKDKKIELRGINVLLDVQLCYFFKVDLNEIRNTIDANHEKFNHNHLFSLNRKDIKELAMQNIIELGDDFTNENHIALSEYNSIMLSFYLKSDSANFFRSHIVSFYNLNIIDNIDYGIIRHFDGYDNLMDMIYLLRKGKERQKIGFKLNDNNK